MSRSLQQIFDRLGEAGLTRALDDLLDSQQLVRLASSCAITYRGMRTQTQRRERLLADLVAKAAKDEGARRAILHSLQKETAPATKQWLELTPEARLERLCDDALLRETGKLGLHLFLVAASEDDSALVPIAARLATHNLLRAASNGASPAAAETAANSRDHTRLKRKLNALEKKLRHVDAQLAKSRDEQRDMKSDLIQRKGELAESRMLAERLRRDLAAARTEAEAATAKNGPAPAPEEPLEELARAVRRLEAAQRKLVHTLGSRPEPAPSPRHAGREVAVAVAEVAEKVLQQGLARQRDELGKEFEAQTRQLAELRAELRGSEESTTARRTARRAKVKSPDARVGVFIDVQNVYYGARRLKGKLDFDALMQAAVADRRLIQATAYVVESEEIDQSQFIARLEKLSIQVQRKALRIRADGSMKGNWDMELALDVLDAAPSLDVVVLVSGDGDFTSLVKRVKKIGPRVEVIGFPRHTAKSLAEAADLFHPLDRKMMIYARKAEETAQADVPVTPQESTNSA